MGDLGRESNTLLLSLDLGPILALCSSCAKGWEDYIFKKLGRSRGSFYNWGWIITVVRMDWFGHIKGRGVGGIHRLNLERLNLERLNAEWTEPRMDWTPNWMNPQWTRTPNGLNSEWTEPRMDWTPNGLNSEWTQFGTDSTPNELNPKGTQPRLDSTITHECIVTVW